MLMSRNGSSLGQNQRVLPTTTTTRTTTSTTTGTEIGIETKFEITTQRPLAARCAASLEAHLTCRTINSTGAITGVYVYLLQSRQMCVSSPHCRTHDNWRANNGEQTSIRQAMPIEMLSACTWDEPSQAKPSQVKCVKFKCVGDGGFGSGSGGDDGDGDDQEYDDICTVFVGMETLLGAPMRIFICVSVAQLFCSRLFRVTLLAWRRPKHLTSPGGARFV